MLKKDKFAIGCKKMMQYKAIWHSNTYIMGVSFRDTNKFIIECFLHPPDRPYEFENGRRVIDIM